MGINFVLANVPATTDELFDGLTLHIDYDRAYLDALLRNMRDAGLIACCDGVWYARGRPPF